MGGLPVQQPVGEQSLGGDLGAPGGTRRSRPQSSPRLGRVSREGE